MTPGRMLAVLALVLAILSVFMTGLPFLQIAVILLAIIFLL